jgi:ATP-binding cassette subfamily B protein
VLWFGATLVVQGRLSPGDLVVFLAYLRRVFSPARDFAKYTARLAKAAAAGQRVIELFNQPAEARDSAAALPAPRFPGRIRFEQVTFGYEPGRPVLERFDLSIPQGCQVAVVGPSGIGKSSLLNLVLRLYEPWEGRVLIDEQDIREFTLDSLRGQISTVLQESLLFAATFEDNIAVSANAASREEIEAAARLANAADFIEHAPQGYATSVGERGVTLSQGQRQRIAIARAALRKSPILLLDEPTMGLDEENHRQVVAALRRLSVGRTTLLVTHDLELAAQADRIVYLDNGHLVEQGTHEELMHMNGRYAAMCRLQGVCFDEGPVRLQPLPVPSHNGG